MYSESKYLVSWRVMTSLWPSWLSRVSIWYILESQQCQVMTSILQSQSSPAGSVCKKGVCWPQRFDVDRAFSCLQRTNSSISVSSGVVQRVGCYACSSNRRSQLPRSTLTHQFAKWHFAVERVWQIFSILTCLCLLLKKWLNLVYIFQ